MDRFQAMRLFTRIVELGSFSRAAEQLSLNRAAATQNIKQLEARLGVRLLARTTRQVTPTVDGAAYYERCVAILSDVEEAEAQFTQATRTPAGRVRLDLSAGMCRNVLLPALPEFTARYPQIRLEISVSDRPIDLLREGVDCVLRAGELRDIPLVARRLALLPQVTCASADYVARHGRPENPDAMTDHRAVDYFSAASGKAIPLEFLVDGQLVTRSLPANIALNSGDSYVAACVTGFGLIQVPYAFVAEGLANGTLCEILPAYRPPALPLSVLYPPNRQLSARVRVFIDWLVELFARPDGPGRALPAA